MGNKNYYTNKIKSFIFLIISAFFSVSFMYYDLGDKKIFSVIIAYFAFILFTFGCIISLFLLFRSKPLLTITDNQIIINTIFGKTRTINFEGISSFYVSTNNFRGIKTAENINIILKSSARKKINKTGKKNNLFGLLFSVDPSIQTDFINVKTKDLLKILNIRIFKT